MSTYIYDIITNTSGFNSNIHLTEYLDIITHAKTQQYDNIATELHHIAPKSIFPTLIHNKDNLVPLTLIDHLKCHLLLVKCTTGMPHRKMAYAWRFMSNRANINLTNVEFTKLSELYTSRYGINHTEETKLKISLSLQGKKRTADQIEAMRLRRLGSIMSDDTKSKISNALQGVPKTTEHIAKSAKSRTGMKRTNKVRNQMSKSAKCRNRNNIELKQISDLGKLRSGDKHHNFTYYYHTPIGKFTSTREANIEFNLLGINISKQTIYNWCIIKCNNKISKSSITKSSYLTNTDLDKTFHDIGFYHST